MESTETSKEITFDQRSSQAQFMTRIVENRLLSRGLLLRGETFHRLELADKTSEPSEMHSSIALSLISLFPGLAGLFVINSGQQGVNRTKVDKEKRHM